MPCKIGRREATMKFDTQIDAKEYDAFVCSHPLCNLLQSSKWANIKADWDSLRCGVRDEKGKLIASALVLIRHLPLGKTMFYLPKGPILDYHQEEVVHFFLDSLKKVGKSYHCIYIKMDPGILKNCYKVDAYEDSIYPEAKQQVNVLRQCGCIHLGYTKSLEDTVQPRFHAAVRKVDDFESTLPKHTKRHLATARKKFVTVDICDASRVDDFAKLMASTEERKQIKLRDAAYYRRLLQTYGDDARLFLACIDLEKLLEDSKVKLTKVQSDIVKCKEKDAGKKASLEKNRDALENDIIALQEYIQKDGQRVPVAGALGVIYGTTCEMLYMGMDSKYRRYMGPYLSHITPMLYAFEHGCTLCNMGGVEGTLDDGLTKFKANFNPDILEYIGEFDLPINRFLYHGAQYALKVRKKMLHRH